MKTTSSTRLPDNYEFVLELVLAAKRQHLTAADVYEIAKRLRPGIGFTTVYRALLRLSDQRLIAEFPSPDGRHLLYDRNVDHHSHFRCLRCEALEDIAFTVPPELWTKVVARRGMAVTGQSFVLEGICARCRGAGPHVKAHRDGIEPKSAKE